MSTERLQHEQKSQCMKAKGMFKKQSSQEMKTQGIRAERGT